eukprot:Protomagalhaensia_sp_Gyna_25__3301@NODE_2999_length_781_cov_45_433962_g595_i1_p1_GENE_NODE_2999_length_781_cov_45_433962_g595_i1NODE_2999_length_781_cov_45_433962_g595_i1_p1_ORF_typecomplete_len156_score37_11_NODE_2999_length_781_cov_45_433962_g595_i1192659
MAREEEPAGGEGISPPAQTEGPAMGGGDHPPVGGRRHDEEEEDPIVEEGMFLLEFPELNSSGFREVFHTMSIEDFSSHKPRLSLNSVFHFNAFWTKGGSCTPTVFRALEVQESATAGNKNVVEMVGFSNNVIVAELSGSHDQKKSLLMIPQHARE